MRDLGRHSTSELRLRCSTKLLRRPVESAAPDGKRYPSYPPTALFRQS